MRRKNSQNSRLFAGFSAIITVLMLTTAVYLGDYYRADTAALVTLSVPPANVGIERFADGTIAFAPLEKQTVGLIFYPGGKVQCEAYAPLLARCAERGIFCVLVQMPGNLAVLNADAAEDVRARFSEVGQWYLGGHSLGGAIAASYAAEHADEYEGLILLAAYAAKDLRGSNLRALTVRGTEDKVLNTEMYAAAQPNLPERSEEVLIDGGCHAYFGSYGAQRGDGIPAITAAEQQAETANVIAEWIGRLE